MSDILNIEFAVVLAMTHLSPREVVKAVAGYSVEEKNEVVRSGFVVQTVEGGFAYLTSFRDQKRRYTEVSTQRFTTEPFHLYERAENWVFDTEKLNAYTEVSKQKANYPTGGLDHSIGSSPVVRFSRPL